MYRRSIRLIPVLLKPETSAVMPLIRSGVNATQGEVIVAGFPAVRAHFRPCIEVRTLGTVLAQWVSGGYPPQVRHRKVLPQVRDVCCGPIR